MCAALQFLRIGHLVRRSPTNVHQRQVARPLTDAELSTIEGGLSPAFQPTRLSAFRADDGTLYICFDPRNDEVLALHVAAVAGRLLGTVACDPRSGDVWTQERLERALTVSSVVRLRPEPTREELEADVARLTARWDPANLPLPGDRPATLAALERTNWNHSKAAALLGITRRTFAARVQAFGLATRPPGS